MSPSEEQLARTIAKDIIVAGLQGINLGPANNHEGKDIGASIGAAYAETLKAVRAAFAAS